ncbi:MAG: hypothetical protein WC768_04640 [Patescibacteria group bacterium]|jgi:hypothetical protein
MSKKIITGSLITIFSLSLLLSLATPVLAENSWLTTIGIPDGQLVPKDCTGAATGTDINQTCGTAAIFQTIVNFSKLILALTGSGALLMFFYGGVLWIIAGGSPERIQKGKTAMAAAAIGIVIILGAFLMVNFTITALGGKTTVSEVLGQPLGEEPSGTK